jgi:hypothetical protein
MNQAVITAERALDPKVGFDWGFKLQLMFGTDARYIHSLRLREHQAGTGLYQADVPEAYLSLHLPVLTEGGVDVKVGKFVTLEGAEKPSTIIPISVILVTSRSLGGSATNLLPSPTSTTRMMTAWVPARMARRNT